MDWLIPVRDLLQKGFPLIERLPVIRAMLGFLMVLLLPGFAWTLVFFQHVSLVERVALSSGLSIVVVTLSLVFLNMLIGVRITGSNAALIITALTILPVVVYYLNRFLGRKRGKAT